MIFIFGTRFFGRVDEVPGLFHVATKFGHLWYIPLIPTGSFLVLSKQGNSIRGVPIGLSGKSVLAAWLRGGLVAAAVICTLGAIVMATDRRPRADLAAAYGVAAAASVVLAALSWRLAWFRRASHERAVALAQAAKLPEEVAVLIDLQYGRITPSEGEELLKELREARTDAASEAPPTLAPARA